MTAILKPSAVSDPSSPPRTVFREDASGENRIGVRPAASGDRDAAQEPTRRFGAVIVSYGQHEAAVKLAHCFRAGAVPVVVVETSPIAIDEHTLPTGTTLVQPGNVGYGSAANLGVAVLLQENIVKPPDILLISNGDCSLETSQVTQLLETLSTDVPGHAAYAVAQQSPDGLEPEPMKVFPNARAHLLFIRHKARAWQFASNSSLYPSGAFIAVSSQAFAELGGFDPRFFLYYEETDLFWRLLGEGHSIGLVPEVVVTHHRGSATSRHLALTRFELGRSSALYGRKHDARLWAYSVTYVAYSITLIGAQALRLRPRRVGVAIGRLAGFAFGLLLPRFEPLRYSKLKVAPYVERAEARRRLIESAARAGMGG